MIPTLNGSSALERYKHGNAIETHNRIMFDFYPGLPHVICLLCSGGACLWIWETMFVFYILSQNVWSLMNRCVKYEVNHCTQDYLIFWVMKLPGNEPCKQSRINRIKSHLHHANEPVVNDTRTATSYLLRMLAHNRRTARAACTLGGIVCMVFRGCSWCNG